MGQLVSMGRFGNGGLTWMCRLATIVTAGSRAGLILLSLGFRITLFTLYLVMIREWIFSSIISRFFRFRTALSSSIGLIYQFTFPKIIYRVLVLHHS